MRTDILEFKERILSWIKENQSKSFMCRQIGCKAETLNTWLAKMDIVYSGNQGAKGKKSDPKRKSAVEYANGTHVKSHVLRLKLIEDGIKEYRCENCDQTEWLGWPIPLELHHIDGNHYNNDFSNLQILCPNCHARA